MARHQNLAHSLDTAFWGTEGAGCVLYATDTGLICLQKRSGSVNEPNTWGVFGGAIDEGESPLGAVKRELSEETGYAGKVTFDKLYVFSKANFKFHNFIAVVPRQFTPQHSWESAGHAWVTLDDLPSPLHFGVKSLLPHLTSYIEALTSGGSGGDVVKRVAARFLRRRALTAPPVHFATYFRTLLRKTAVDIRRMKKNVGILRQAQNEYENKYEDNVRGLRYSFEDIETGVIPELERALGFLERTDLKQSYAGVKADLRLENFEERWRLLIRFAEVPASDVDATMKENEVPDDVAHLYTECIALCGAFVARIRSLRARLDSDRGPSTEDTEKASPAFEKLEKLYHASIKARELFDRGFSKETPGRGTGLGLGGSVSDKAGHNAISFTSDASYAHEIARWFKEMTLVARGQITALQILKLSQREGNLEKVVEDFMGMNGVVGRDDRPEGETRLVVERGKWRVVNVKWVSAEQALVEETGDLDVLFRSKKAINKLYTAYTRASGHRHDMAFMETDALLERLERENVDPRDIGVIVAEIDMTDPDISYHAGEQEYRVQPKSIKRVLRFM